MNTADAPTPSDASVLLTLSSGNGSSSMIVPDAEPATITAPCGSLNTSSKLSLSSSRVSHTVGTDTVADVSPATIRNCRGADSKPSS